MKVLVTGSGGYIGSVLVPMLIHNGFDVMGLDICYYCDGNLNNYKFPQYKLIKKDIRDITDRELENEKFEAIIHLAALSNDPLGFINEDLTYDINFKASVRLAKIAKSIGIKRFIFASSCSLYGASNEVLSEVSRANPQTAYGKSKILAEKEIAKLADDSFSPVFMRNATAFGFSPRMRFDIVVNSLTGFAYVENEIKILGDGTPWRPLVHVKDISKSIIKVLLAKKESIHNQVFNVGNDNENYQILEIAKKVQDYFNCNISIAKKDAKDTRNYAVSFKKIESRLDFKIDYTLTRGIEELKTIYEKIKLSKNNFNSRLYNRLLQIEYLLKTEKIDKTLKFRD